MKAELLAIAEKAIDKSLMEALGSYNSPLHTAIKESLSDSTEHLKQMAKKSIDELIYTDEFQQQMNSAIKQKLARVLISQFGGEVEKTVNKLKADPTTRAKITLAVDKMMEDILNDH